MNANVKQYIEENIELIDNDEFDELYRHCPKSYTHHLTFALQQSGIQPELFMTKLPFCFMFGNPLIERFVVPSNIEVVENNAFESSHIKTIVFDTNSSVRTLETCCFAHSKVEYIQWPSALYMINTECFKSCWELKQLTLPDGLFTIGVQAFADCRNLIKVTIPASVNMIGAGAFHYCSKLTTVVFEKGSQAKIGIGAFGSTDQDSFAAHHPDLTIMCYKDDPVIENLIKLGYKVSVIG